ncbi:MAG: chemotaxis protein CheC [Thiotrichaceae bacterium]
MHLTELQRDAITELLNIGMGYAAFSLSQMLDDEVKLSIPSVELLSRQDAAAHIEADPYKRIVAVKQHFRGSFWGDVFLLFPKEKSLDLVKALMKQNLSQDVLTELEQDALMEVGNVILNSCLSTLADMLMKEEVSSGLPVFMIGSAQEVLDTRCEDEGCDVFAYGFSKLHSSNISGYVAFDLDVSSIHRFKAGVNEYIKECSILAKKAVVI